MPGMSIDRDDTGGYLTSIYPGGIVGVQATEQPLQGVKQMRSPVFNATVTNDLAQVDPGTDIEVALEYDVSHPLSVFLYIGREEQVEWEFSRELLLWGLDEDAGEGDVTLWPSATDVDTLYILLRSPDVSLVIGLDRGRAWDFLEDTYAVHNGVVTPEDVGVDGTISKILGRTSQ